MLKNKTYTFTFQSGSIQIQMLGAKFVPRDEFTFQSGSIQMLSHYSRIFLVKHLHSNLVLFKCQPPFAISQISCIFTFQFGSIQIERRLHKLY